MKLMIQSPCLDEEATLPATLQAIPQSIDGIDSIEILVVDDGRIVERGRHEELLALEGLYYELYTRQHGLEQNLFLAPGEGDSDGEAETGEGKDRNSLAEALRILRE